MPLPDVRPELRGVFAALLFGLFAACEGETGPEPEAALPEYEGLSPEQIESQAEPMTPEEAERLGIVDTANRIGPPVGPDSVVPLENPILPADTGSR